MITSSLLSPGEPQTARLCRSLLKTLAYRDDIGNDVSGGSSPKKLSSGPKMYLYCGVCVCVCIKSFVETVFTHTKIYPLLTSDSGAGEMRWLSG